MYIYISFTYIYCQDTGSHPAANLININREIGEGAASDFSVNVDSQTKLLFLFDRTGVGLLHHSNMQNNLHLFIYFAQQNHGSLVSNWTCKKNLSGNKQVPLCFPSPPVFLSTNVVMRKQYSISPPRSPLPSRPVPPPAKMRGTTCISYGDMGPESTSGWYPPTPVPHISLLLTLPWHVPPNHAPTENFSSAGEDTLWPGVTAPLEPEGREAPRPSSSEGQEQLLKAAVCHSQGRTLLPGVWALPAATWFISASAGPGAGRSLCCLSCPEPLSPPAPVAVPTHRGKVGLILRGRWGLLLPCWRSRVGAEQVGLHREAVPAGFGKASSGMRKGFSAFIQAHWGVDLINADFIWMSSPVMLSILPSCITLPCLGPTVGTEELSAGSGAAGRRGMEAGAETRGDRPGSSQAVCAPRQAVRAVLESRPDLRTALPLPGASPQLSLCTPFPALRFYGYNQIITFIKFEITF